MQLRPSFEDFVCFKTSVFLSFIHKGAYNSLIKGQGVRLHCCANLPYGTSAAQGHCGVFKQFLFPSKVRSLSKSDLLC